MMMPATASTGITAFTPISGTSAAARITPVPKPLIPLIVAATSASTATAASVGASSSNLGGRHRARAPVAIDRHVGQRRLGHLDDLRIGRPALGVDLDVHRDRGAPDLHQVDVEGEQVADLHRLLEDELLHRHCGDAAAGRDRKSTRLNSSHSQISYAVFCLK